MIKITFFTGLGVLLLSMILDSCHVMTSEYAAGYAFFGGTLMVLAGIIAVAKHLLEVDGF